MSVSRKLHEDEVVVSKAMVPCKACRSFVALRLTRSHILKVCLIRFILAF